jgi:hypothetical protein
MASEGTVSRMCYGRAFDSLLQAGFVAARYLIILL